MFCFWACSFCTELISRDPSPPPTNILGSSRIRRRVLLWKTSTMLHGSFAFHSWGICHATRDTSFLSYFCLAVIMIEACHAWPAVLFHQHPHRRGKSMHLLEGPLWEWKEYVCPWRDIAYIFNYYYNNILYRKYKYFTLLLWVKSNNNIYPFYSVD